MAKKKSSILITLDSMKDPNTGLFYFGKALFESVSKQNSGKFDLNFYVRDRTGFFKQMKDVSLYHLYKIHKIFFPYFNHFNLVHVTDQFARLKPSKVNAKKVLTIHDINPIHEPGVSQEQINAHISNLKQHIDKCDRIVTISGFVADDIRTHFPESAHKISVIYNGADELVVDEGFLPAYVPDAPFLFTIGPLDVKKNFHVLPALLEGNNYKLVVSGITPTPAYTERIKAEAAKFNCADRLVITGAITDKEKAWYYKNCLAFAFPSLAEGFGLPVIEAMNFGKPVFLSNKTSLPEIGGEHAFYFENFEADHMQAVFKAGMQKYADDQMAPLIKSWASAFTWNRTATQYLNLYQELLNER